VPKSSARRAYLYWYLLWEPLQYLSVNGPRTGKTITSGCIIEFRTNVAEYQGLHLKSVEVFLELMQNVYLLQTISLRIGENKSGQRLDIPQSNVHFCKMDSNPGSSPSEAPYYPRRTKMSSRALDNIFAHNHNKHPSLSRSSLEEAIHLENLLSSH
jgi:hypothetical protein